MCGICGIIDFDGRPVDRDLVIRMRDVMTCRGPDACGLHVGPGAALGHRRLSIIDLSPAAAQPMTNEDGTAVLVFNGEIYNFQDLRPELEAAGHQFKSRSDSEVALHGYEQWGLDGLAKRILGMFAAAIWDSRKRQLHLLRDHLGKKPLFYQAVGGRVMFASDIKALWIANGRRVELDEQALDEFFYYTVISGRRTIFRGVHRLPPAHAATFDASGEKLTRFWSPDYSAKQAKSVDEWLEGIDHHLRRAVRRRLVADVPLGGFLSGGVDSSTVCALMAAEGHSRPKTFTVGFTDAARWDERRFSRAVAERIGSEHTELIVKPDVAPILSDLVWHYGEPFGDSSAVPTYLIAREARKHVTVVLTGDGGDEAFAGYSRHRRPWLAHRWRAIPGFIRRRLLPLAARGVGVIAPRTLFARNLELSAGHLAGDVRALAAATCWFDGWRDILYTPDFRSRLGAFHPLEAQRPLMDSLRGPTAVDKASEYLLLTTLCDDYLVKVDVATMAHSLEARCPFLDVELLNFAMTIPAGVLLEGNQAKSLLKRYAARLVPPEVVYRKKKGFSVPIRQWMQNEWAAPLERLLLSKTALDRGYFDPRTVRRIIGEHVSGRRNHVARLWTLLVFETWNRLFVDQTLKPGEPVLI
ncbi:MAG: asparagine synthase (glutamine-hydrolyzing) [Phycisphaerae bacterium]